MPRFGRKGTQASYRQDIFLPANGPGHRIKESKEQISKIAVTVPLSRLDKSWVGIQLVSKRFDEATIPRVGAFLGRSVDWARPFRQISFPTANPTIRCLADRAPLVS